MPEQDPTLRDMIRAANASGLTYERIAKNAIDPETGHKASAGHINDIARGAVNRLPETKNLRAIAVGLGVPYERVRQAAIREWLPPEPGATAADIPDDRKAQLIAELEQLRDIADRALREAEGAGGAPAA